MVVPEMKMTHTVNCKTAWPKGIVQVLDIVLDDRWVKVQEIAGVIGISTEWIINAFYKLDVAILFNSPKLIRIGISQTSLKHFKQDKLEFKHRFITVNVTWIHYYTQERK